MSRVLPILFNTDMVRAILDGRKTVTRRVVGEKVAVIREDQEVNRNLDGKFELYNVTQRCGIPQNVFFKPPYLPGDILYVRETWCRGSLDYKKEQYYYKADNVDFSCRWHPSIHMPKAAARIWLEVTDVRVERLQNIDCEGAMKEGIDPRCCINLNHTVVRFSKLWNSTLKKSDLGRYGWDANPWVWVIEFKRCKKPEKEE